MQILQPVFLHLLRSSLNSLGNVLQILAFKFCTFFIKFILNFFLKLLQMEAFVLFCLQSYYTFLIKCAVGSCLSFLLFLMLIFSVFCKNNPSPYFSKQQICLIWLMSAFYFLISTIYFVIDLFFVFFLASCSGGKNHWFLNFSLSLKEYNI